MTRERVPTPGERNDGFSLMEVLMAMLIAAVLATALLSVQAQSIAMGDSSDLAWQTMNTAQEILARRFPQQTVNPTGSWVTWPYGEKTRFRIDKAPVRGDDKVDAMSLEIDHQEYLMSWLWYSPHRLYFLKTD